MSSTKRQRPRTPGFIYAGLSMAVLLMVGVVALTASQPPPPTIAEFAPQAQEQIQDAPEEQSSEFGSGEGECPPEAPNCEGESLDGEPTATPPLNPTPEPVEVARVRRCVGDPPRQIADPQSPPCVPYWEGDNGGATYQGVTEQEIRIGVPNYSEDFHPIFAAFFNNRFEFYGRQLRLIPLDGNKTEREEQQASAVKADESEQVFGAAEMYQGFYFQEELARRELISVARDPLMTDAFMRQHAPYIWGYPMAIDQLFANVGEWVCARLAGRSPEYAGTGVDGSRRAFGLILQVTADANPVGSQPLERELAKCGEHIVETVRYGWGNETLDPAKGAQVALKMSEADVTSIICLCDGAVVGSVGRGATGQAYYPEWLVSTYIQNDIPWTLRAFIPPEQLEHLFGVTFLPRLNKPQDSPAWWAAKEVKPERDPPTDPVQFTEWKLSYRSLLLLSSGIQMAGPQLTPKTFQEGLHRTRFPNPDHPIKAGAVNFVERDWTMTNDAAEFWWSNRARGPNSGEAGAICYVEGGARRKRGGWPSDPAPFFEGPCDSGA